MPGRGKEVQKNKTKPALYPVVEWIMSSVRNSRQREAIRVICMSSAEERGRPSGL